MDEIGEKTLESRASEQIYNPASPLYRVREHISKCEFIKALTDLESLDTEAVELPFQIARLGCHISLHDYESFFTLLREVVVEGREEVDWIQFFATK